MVFFIFTNFGVFVSLFFCFIRISHHFDFISPFVCVALQARWVADECGPDAGGGPHLRRHLHPQPGPAPPPGSAPPLSSFLPGWPPSNNHERELPMDGLFPPTLIPTLGPKTSPKNLIGVPPTRIYAPLTPPKARVSPQIPVYSPNFLIAVSISIFKSRIQFER